MGSYRHMVYKIFFLPGSGTNFLTTHQDGYVRMFDIRQVHICIVLIQNRQRDKEGKQVVRLKKKGRGNMSANSLAFVPTNPNLFILGGADPYIRLYDMV